MPIPEKLKAIFNTNDPLPFEQYMAWNNATYYAHDKPLIAPKGDFITAPEISSLFGEMIALWIILQWQNLGTPQDIQLVEMGPGNGTLMHDILHTLTALKKRNQIPFHIKNVFLLETSPSLKRRQKNHLSSSCNLHHANTIADLQKKAEQHPTLFLANEFFDALPVAQYRLTAEQQWEKLYIHLEHDSLSPRFCPTESIPAYITAHASAPGLYEYCAALEEILPPLFKMLEEKTGAFLFLDYGGRTPKKDTLQALKHHRFTSLYAAPGDVDLTAHVDFQHIQSFMPPSYSATYETQGAFLKNMGILLRLKTQLPKLSPPAQKNLIQATERLIGEDPQGKNMGRLFKVLGGTTHAK